MKSDRLDWKKLVATVTVLLVAVAAIWIYMIKSYDSELGTSNVVVVEASGMQPDNNSNNELLHLSFADDADEGAWDVTFTFAGQGLYLPTTEFQNSSYIHFFKFKFRNIFYN